MAVDAAGTVYLSDDNHTIRRVTLQSVLNTLAGDAMNAGSADGTGVAARFRYPDGLVVDSAGNLFVADSGNHAIRRVTPSGEVTTVAGVGLENAQAHTDGQGQAARFHTLSGITRGPAGELYVADAMHNSIRRVSPDGIVTTLPVSLNMPVPSTEGSTGVLFPVALAADRFGNLFYTDNYRVTVNKVTPAGIVHVLYQGQNPGYRLDAVAADQSGNVYFTETRSLLDFDVRKIAPDGSVSIFVRQSDFLTPGPGNPIRHVPTALTVDANDDIYLAYSANVTVRGSSPASQPWLARIEKITPAGACTLFAGGDADNYSDGPAASAGVSLITGLAWDEAGRLFIADSANGAVRMMESNGNVSTLAGRINSYFSLDGVGQDVGFADLKGIAVGSDGRVFVTDASLLREGLPAGPPMILTQPQGLSITAGGAVQFSVTASGIPEPTYQWFHNGMPLAGATSRILGFENARTSDAGEYTVTLSNALGTTTSTKAVLTVTPATPPPSAPSAPASPAGASGGGGGGGAPSWWFLATLGVLAFLRRLRGFPDTASAWQPRAF